MFIFLDTSFKLVRINGDSYINEGKRRMLNTNLGGKFVTCLVGAEGEYLSRVARIKEKVESSISGHILRKNNI